MNTDQQKQLFERIARAVSPYLVGAKVTATGVEATAADGRRVLIGIAVLVPDEGEDCAFG